jgi:CRISPR-associated protein Cas1
LNFFTEQGRFLARVEGPVSGNVLLRRGQYRASDDATSAATLAAVLVAAKIANSRFVLQRSLRDRPESVLREPVQAAIDHLATLLRRVRNGAMDLDAVRGYEGAAARAYFEVLDHLILNDEESFRFHGRNRRPPRDAINALLSFVYTLLRHDIASALEGVGLDPAVGFLHRDRPGRPALALDMMEEMRAPIADRLVLALINRKQLKASGFTVTESGAVSMDEATRKAVLVAWQERKRETLRHPFLDETVEIGLIPHLQARLLAKYLRRDLDAYPAFIWR